MNRSAITKWAASLPPVIRYIRHFLMFFVPLFLIELLCLSLLRPETALGLGFGALWAGMLAGFILCLPRLAGRIVFGILYFVMLLWSLAQAGYYLVFGKMMWVSTIALAGEGAGYLGDVLASFPFLWWASLVGMLALGVLVLVFFPHPPKKILRRIPFFAAGVLLLVGLCILPKAAFAEDDDQYRQSSSRHSIYHTMFDAKKAYDIAGIYQLTLRDIWVNELYPLTPGYRSELDRQNDIIDAFFAQRGGHTDNEMTGRYTGKNVILVLMESMDDWMITHQDTPTIKKLMNESIRFANFYTPGYGSARTLNSEFCMNTGIYLPTTGNDLSEFFTNSFDQSIASQMTANGYSSKVFHYNDPAFYNRGVLEPAMGYENYVAYSAYEKDRNRLCDDNLLFEIPEVSDQFFRDGATFNTVITRSAHLGYTYNEIITSVAVKKYPEYVGLYASEEECSARLKAKLVDDFFKRLLQELEDRGQLENTVIVAMTDHYTYGYKNMQELYAHSKVDSDLLLEKVPCFIWAADKPSMQIDKVLNTSDLVPTVLNLMGIDSPYNYLGQDAFDANYKGYAIFPDGSWVCDGVAWQNGNILMNTRNQSVSQEEIDAMAKISQQYRNVSNLLLTSNYYSQ